MERIEQLRLLCWQKAGVDRSVHGMTVALQQINEKLQWLQGQALLRDVGAGATAVRRWQSP